MRASKQIAGATVMGLFFFAAGCLDPFSAPKTEPGRNLVVNGHFNGDDGTCEVYLTRVISTESFGPPPSEENAEVNLVGPTGSFYPLSEITPGKYAAFNLDFQEGDSIQLKIKTADNEGFESATISILRTPAIDSLTWESKAAGLAIKVSAHSDKSIRYYYWSYSETWNYFAAYETAVTVNEDRTGIVELNEPIYECWTTLLSTDILVSRASRRDDGTMIVSEFPIATIPWSSPKVQSHYSMEVEQRAISKEAFEYLEELRKNTENLGSLFDALPSAPTGNIRCVTRPDEIVLGNFFASSRVKQRILLDELNWDRPGGTRSITGYESCLLLMPPRDLHVYYPVGLGVEYPYLYASHSCVDCRLNGGTNVRPDFWIW